MRGCAFHLVGKEPPGRNEIRPRPKSPGSAHCPRSNLPCVRIPRFSRTSKFSGRPSSRGLTFKRKLAGSPSSADGGGILSTRALEIRKQDTANISIKRNLHRENKDEQSPKNQSSYRESSMKDANGWAPTPFVWLRCGQFSIVVNASRKKGRRIDRDDGRDDNIRKIDGSGCACAGVVCPGERSCRWPAARELGEDGF